MPTVGAEGESCVAEEWSNLELGNGKSGVPFFFFSLPFPPSPFPMATSLALVLGAIQLTHLTVAFPINIPLIEYKKKKE